MKTEDDYRYVPQIKSHWQKYVVLFLLVALVLLYQGNRTEADVEQKSRDAEFTEENKELAEYLVPEEVRELGAEAHITLSAKRNADGDYVARAVYRKAEEATSTETYFESRSSEPQVFPLNVCLEQVTLVREWVDPGKEPGASVSVSVIGLPAGSFWAARGAEDLKVIRYPGGETVRWTQPDVEEGVQFTYLRNSPYVRSLLDIPVLKTLFQAYVESTTRSAVQSAIWFGAWLVLVTLAVKFIRTLYLAAPIWWRPTLSKEERRLGGTWYESDGRQITFRLDGTYIVGKNTDRSGTWQLQRLPSLRLSFEPDPFGRNPYGRPAYYWLRDEIAADSLKLVDERGHDYTFMDEEPKEESTAAGKAANTNPRQQESATLLQRILHVR